MLPKLLRTLALLLRPGASSGQEEPDTTSVKSVFPVAKEGLLIVVAPILASVAAAAAGWYVVAAAFLIAGLAMAMFFRDPRRQVVALVSDVLCPADGKVVSVAEADEPDYLQARSRRVSVFMSLLNVHMNYAPIGGGVEFLNYRKGRFRRADLPEASLTNESNSIGIRGEQARVMMRQIAGKVARRIVCRVKVNDPVRAGEKIGLIKFGSRVDVFLPLDCEVLVKEGERVKGGISRIARLK